MEFYPNHFIAFDIKKLTEIFRNPSENFISELKSTEVVSSPDLDIPTLINQSLVYEHLKVAKSSFDRYNIISFYYNAKNLILCRKNESFGFLTDEDFFSVGPLVEIMNILKPNFGNFAARSKAEELLFSVESKNRKLVQFWLSINAPRIWNSNHFLLEVDSKDELAFTCFFNDEKIKKEDAENFMMQSLITHKLHFMKYFCEKIKIEDRKNVFERALKTYNCWGENRGVKEVLKSLGMQVSIERNQLLREEIRDYFPIMMEQFDPKYLNGYKGWELEAVKYLLEMRAQRERQEEAKPQAK